MQRVAPGEFDRGHARDVSRMVTWHPASVLRCHAGCGSAECTARLLEGEAPRGDRESAANQPQHLRLEGEEGRTAKAGRLHTPER